MEKLLLSSRHSVPCHVIAFKLFSPQINLCYFCKHPALKSPQLFPLDELSKMVGTTPSFPCVCRALRTFLRMSRLENKLKIRKTIFLFRSMNKHIWRRSLSRTWERSDKATYLRKIIKVGRDLLVTEALEPCPQRSVAYIKNKNNILPQYKYK